MSRVIKTDPDILGGEPVFEGTRVPIAVLFDYLQDGDPLDEFLADYPSVMRAQVVALLAEVRQETIKSAKEAA